MLLTIATNCRPARNLGFLLGKHPDRFQRFPLSFGEAVVFFPQADDDRCQACLMLDVDTVDLVRGKTGKGQKRGNAGGASLAESYVNDRPYVASSLLSVAISRVFGSAVSGTCVSHPNLPQQQLPWEVTIDVLPAYGGQTMLESIFQPLGYKIQCQGYPLDEQLPDLGQSHYYSVSLQGEARLQDLLSHLYVLIPVFDHYKHYFIGEAEVEKLLRHGEGWLADHPKRDWITRRYLPHRHSLVNDALKRLSPELDEINQQQEVGELSSNSDDVEPVDSTVPRLHEMRLIEAVRQLLNSGAKSVVDLGCGEGRLIQKLLQHKQFEKIVGVDVSIRSLEIATRRLRMESKQIEIGANVNRSETDDSAPTRRLRLLHGALTYRDDRLSGFDAAALVEVIEHIDIERLPYLEKVVFDAMKYQTVIVTTPNSEFNIRFESMAGDEMRHRDHRFEWTQAEFQIWAEAICKNFNYQVSIYPVGPEDSEVGAPSQMAVFTAT